MKRATLLQRAEAALARGQCGAARRLAAKASARSDPARHASVVERAAACDVPSRRRAAPS